MKNIVITGGTDGMGKITARHFLQNGHRVMVVGSTKSKGEQFLAEAQQLGAGDRAIFVQANLGSIAENQRLIETIKTHFDRLDVLVFCAARFQNHYGETQDGFEISFAIYYLSRFLLSYGLRELLEKAPAPVIFNVAAPGIKGQVQWDDLQFRGNYKGLKASFHGSRLNDLMAVAFAENAQASGIRYILYNPGFIGTEGVTEAFDNPVAKRLVKVVARLFALSPEQGAAYIIERLNNPPAAPLSAFNQQKPVSLTMETFNPANAQRLYQITQKLLQETTFAML